MRKLFLSTVTVGLAFSIFADPVSAAIITTDAGLAGKTFCWLDDQEKFGADHPNCRRSVKELTGGLFNYSGYAGNGLGKVCWAGWRSTTEEAEMQESLSDLGGLRDFSRSALTSFAIARPVTTADLLGKKICWSNPVYGQDTAVYGGGNKW
jgi:hypothetical protein